MIPKSPLPLLCGIAAALLSGCLFDQQARRGSVIENEVYGTLYEGDGDPAVGATVRIFPVGHVPRGGLVKRAADTGIVELKTDAKGRYYLKDLFVGQYNILGDLDGQVSYRDSVGISDATDSVAADTLGAAGSLTARLQLEPNHDPAHCFVQVLGTHRFLNADSAGRFTLDGFAAGEYSVRVSTTLPQYTPWFGSLRIRAGRKDTLEAPIRLPYSGIPVAPALGIAYDTARGLARFSWSPVKYGFLKEYLVFRSRATDIAPPETPIARTRDTFFVDDLSRLAVEGAPEDSRRFEYRVKVRNLSDQEGLAFGIAEVVAAPRSRVATALSFRAVGGGALRASVGDTLRVAVTWDNPRRGLDSLSWSFGNDGVPLRSLRVSGRQGADTLVLVLPSLPGSREVEVRMRDSLGDAWTGSAEVRTVLDAPVAYAGRDTQVTVRDRVILKASSSQEFGTIVKWEWDIGGKGAFVQGSPGDAMVSAGERPGTEIHVLRTTDDDGNMDLDTLNVTVANDVPTVWIDWRTDPSLGAGAYTFAAKESDLGVIVKWEWDIGGTGVWRTGSGPDTVFIPAQAVGTPLTVKVRATDEDGNAGIAEKSVTISRWTVELAPFPAFEFPSWEFTVAESGGIVYLAGGSFGYYPGNGLAAFDPIKGTYKGIKGFPGVARPTLASEGGWLYVIGGQSGTKRMSAYDPETGIWTQYQLPRDVLAAGAATVAGKIYVIGGGIGNENRVDEYHPPTDSWRRLKDAPWIFSSPGVAVHGGLIYAIQDYGSGPAKFLSFDPANETWKFLASPPGITLGGRITLVSMGDHLYVLGFGTQTLAYHPETGTWKEKSPLHHLLRARSAASVGGRIYAYSAMEIVGAPISSNGIIMVQTYDPTQDP